MPSDEVWVARPKMRKRKRKAEGEDISERLSPRNPYGDVKDPGLHCKSCRKRLLWRELDCSYERRSGDLHRAWWCGRCGDMLKLDNMTDLGFVYEDANKVRLEEG